MSPVRVLVLIDGEGVAEQLIPSALKACRATGRQLLILSVCQAEGFFVWEFPNLFLMRKEAAECADKWLRACLELIPDDVAAEGRICVNRPGVALSQTLRTWGPDLVVMSQPRKTIWHWWHTRWMVWLCARRHVPIDVAQPVAESALIHGNYVHA